MASITCTTDSRSAGAACITLLATRPAKSFWKKPEALAQHVAVREPAHARGHRPGDELVLDQLVRGRDQRPRDHRHERHPQQDQAVLVEEGGRRLRAPHHVDQAADERQQRYLDQRAEEARHQQQRERRPHRPDEPDVERPQRFRRARGWLVRESVDAGFKPAVHGPIALKREETRMRPDGWYSRGAIACILLDKGRDG